MLYEHLPNIWLNEKLLNTHYNFRDVNLWNKLEYTVSQYTLLYLHCMDRHECSLFITL